MRHLVALPTLSLVGFLACSCGGGNAAARPECPAGQTSLDGTCVSQQIADYVGCIRAMGATVAADSAKSLSAAAGVAGVTGSTQAEVKDKLEKSYAKVSDENAQTIIRNCDSKTNASHAGGSLQPSAAAAPRAYAIEDMNYWNDDYAHVDGVTDPQACARLCDAEPRCKIASFHPEGFAGTPLRNVCVLRWTTGIPHPEDFTRHHIQSWVKPQAADGASN